MVTPAESVIAEFTALGIELRASSDTLRYRPARALPAGLAERARSCKPELLRLLAPYATQAEYSQHVLDEMREQNVGGLAPGRLHWPEDAREAFEERAGIVEFDAGHDRETAELMAEFGIRRCWADRARLGS